MGNVQPNTYHLRPNHLLFVIPVNILAELKAGDTLELEGYPGTNYTLSEKDVSCFDMYEPQGVDDICLLLRRTSDNDPYEITGLSVFRDF